MWRFAFNHGLWDPCNVQLSHVFRCISTTDQENALKFAYKRDVKSFLAARLLTLYMARRLFGLDPINVNVKRSEYRRPYLEGELDFDFNLSHNGDFTLLTSCHEMRTGVDVMQVELPPASGSVAGFLLKMKSLFAPSEWHLLTSTNCEDGGRIRNFFRLWCLKEAFVKNIGTGLRTDISTVEFDLSGAAPKCTYPGLVDTEWRFEEHQLPNSHVAAVAWYNPGALNKCSDVEPFQELSPNDLLATLSPWNEVKDHFWSAYCFKDMCPPSARRVLY
ncbi:L aminoadipate semialdehyde [Echinococcus multilocularis]|uniref:L-aminoadipate-semialdehyde dehydrogenase-phosphopantetheinyl transferase n=1 Tax=Echinococcus multilocularis TaxID=6211 RepID=A0A068YDD0_ECHMU|nr:L aminoadipate semialdehyde [Echinococcus multilocularis]